MAVHSARPTPPVYVLGGYQTDFARNYGREGLGLVEVLRETVHGALADAALDAAAIEVGHVGNFIGELLSNQGHLGGLLVEAEPALAGIPTARHEAACASGGAAALAALADLGAGRCDVALVLGVELLRVGSTLNAQAQLGVAAWTPHEIAGVTYPWAKLLNDIADEYEHRYGALERAHLVALAQNNFAAAKRNPRAQTRAWKFGPNAFAPDDEHNPVIHGRLRRHDCTQVTDGAAALILASQKGASEYAAQRGLSLSQLPRIAGWGHRTGRLSLAHKLADSRGADYVFPHVRGAIADAFARAGLPAEDALAHLDVIECHDCFTMMEYMLLDHLGFGPPGQPGRAIESGRVLRGGKTPVNPGGGLMGIGHPVGATGVRMLLDAANQVRGRAAGFQVDGARRAAAVNIGGSATTCICTVMEAS